MCKTGTQRKSLKAQAIYINSAKQYQGQYIPKESIIKDSAARINFFLHREQWKVEID